MGVKILEYMAKDIVVWIVIVFLVVLASFFSASETSLSSCNKLRLKKMASDGNKRASMVLKLSNQYGKALTALLIGNTVLNIIVSTIGTIIFSSYFGSFGPGISTIFFTVVLLLFSEIIPKTYANSKAESVAMKNVYFIYFFSLLFTPFVFFFDKIGSSIAKLNSGEKKPEITEQELKFMLSDIKGQGILEDREGELARSALDLDEIVASEVMTPRVDLVAVGINSTSEEVKEVFLKEKYSRILVYKENIDNVMGIISEKEFFRRYLYNSKFEIKNIVEKIFLIPPQMNVSELMKKFQIDKINMAVVVDQYGGVEGIVTFEDIIKQLVGDIYYDRGLLQKKDIVVVDGKRWKVNPDVSVNFIFKEICPNGFLLENEQTGTVGGWILENLEKLPKVGDSFVFKGFRVVVAKMKRKRIVEVLIEKLEEEI